MNIIVRKYMDEDLPFMIEIWNDIVIEGNAFPQMDVIDIKTAREIFPSQSFTGVAVEGDEIVGLYILHPNNIGRCGHIGNSSYGVKKGCRGKNIGEKLVVHSLAKAKELGFKIMQFNAVVKNNKAAICLYKKLGFSRLGTIPQGFLLKDGSYEDIILYYKNIK
ncbi:L-amino acid N-acyltransferase YncA [Natranaerovirga pectinivora]|uniref:L-amino acid N-acyltransferase YncA n=1 Tax=Natranaerovirga pectinivora TaxID=682400 RepID=A0A4R3MPC5_9FIRM|nr:GNAT family N-acetyltransferase [Natranaerovirga pectinivora]TCT16121.1 L-amino acid N-acyltransferase YncA [Natranaerovirga pectinivora]